MALNTGLALMLIVSFLMILSGDTHVAIRGNSEQHAESVDLDKVDFHYVIFQNVVLRPEKPEISRRNMSVLLDEDAFSEGTLRRLFEVLSEGFPKPEMLSITVITSVKQTVTPQLGQSGSPTPPDYFDHHRASYTRTPTYVFFGYTPTPTSRELKYVILRDDREKSKGGPRR